VVVRADVAPEEDVAEAPEEPVVPAAQGVLL